MPTARVSPKAGLVPEFLLGLRAALAGLRVWGRRPRLMAIGLVPGVITAAVFAAAAVVVLVQLESWSAGIAGALTAGDGWLATAVQVVAALAILGASALVGIYAFTAVTLLVGQPFFEALSREVDAERGFTGADPEESGWRSFLRETGEALRLAALTVPLSAALFLLGLIPVVGGVAAFVAGVGFGGWFLALELTTSPLGRRGVVALRARRALLGRHRSRAVGFGAACFLAFLIPLGAVAFMPAAVAGATLLVERLGPPEDLSRRPPPAPPS